MPLPYFLETGFLLGPELGWSQQAPAMLSVLTQHWSDGHACFYHVLEL